MGSIQHIDDRRRNDQLLSFTVGDGAKTFGRALDGFERVLLRFPDDRWAVVTPCDPWTAFEVTEHVIDGVRWAFELIGNSEPQKTSESDPCGFPDLLSRWHAARSTLNEVIQKVDPGKVLFWPFGAQSIDTGLRWFSLEVLIHTWDLASAIGEDVRLDPQLVHDHLLRLRPSSRYLRGPGGYGPELEALAGADEQSQLLAFLGRRS
jgi:uncharacterized protein (TIGR03086 family)